MCRLLMFDESMRKEFSSCADEWTAEKDAILHRTAVTKPKSWIKDGENHLDVHVKCRI